MPGMDGYEVSRQLRLRPELRTAVLVNLSGYTQETYRRCSLEDGCDYFHPLVIYRHQVIKQADVVLAMFLLGHEFSPEQKRRNFDYYDQVTTGDSSLSACIQSIVAFEIGYDELALRYLFNALLMDLADVGGNVKDGCHIASMGGTWMGVVYGLAGLRDYGGRLSFHPNKQVRHLRFHLTVRGQLLTVDISPEGVAYNLEQGDGLTLYHRDERLDLRPGEPVRRA